VHRAHTTFSVRSTTQRDGVPLARARFAQLAQTLI
jgi:hypothetical protein